MPNLTPNLNLKKPLLNEVADIDVLNENFDTIDSAIAGKAPASHTHIKTDITDFAHTHTKANITDFAHNHTYSDISNSSPSGSKGVRKSTISTSDPSGGSDGEVWFKYTP